MWRVWFWFFLGMWAVAQNRDAALTEPAGGGFLAAPQTMACLPDELRQAIRNRLRETAAAHRIPANPGAGHPLMVWPVIQNPQFHDRGIWAITNFVDQDPAFPDMLLDYEGGERTYDTTGGYNHQGVDIFLWPFGWEMMDRDQAWVVAAAAGTIIGKDDGHFDRNCVLPPADPDWNGVYVQHADGSVAWYGHLKLGSLTTKPVGAAVAAGEYLGVVGSSGNSTGPHLHFEIYDSLAALNDPYQGPFNSMNAESWWLDQYDYYESYLLRLMTHDDAPALNGFCPEDQIINRANSFLPGDRVYTSVHYRDQRQGQVTQLALLRPNGSTFQSWSHSIPEPHAAASWWYWFWDLPNHAPEGLWTFRATYEGETVSHRFAVGDCGGQFLDMVSLWPQVDVRGLVPYAFCATVP